MTPDNDPPDENASDDEERPSGLFGAIRLMVQTLADAERDETTTFRKSGRVPGDHFTTEFGFSGQIGGPRDRDETDSDRRSLSSPARESGQADSDSYRVDVREGEDQLVVVADMPDVDAKDITAGLDADGHEVVVGVSDEAVERVELPWPADDVEAQFQHGILELRLSREGEK